MSDNRRTKIVAIALAVTMIAGVLVGGGVLAQTDDGNETDGNETVAANDTQTDAENETTGMNETANETEEDNETLGEDDNETEGMNETANETEEDNETLGEDNETAAENETAEDETETAAQTDEEEVATQQTAYLRVAHVTPGVEEVDVMVDGDEVATELGYDTVTDYQTVEGGERNVTVVASSTGEVVFEDDVTVEPRAATTFAAATGEILNESQEEEFTEDQPPELEATSFEDDAFEPEDGTAAVKVAHLSPDAENVDVTLEENDTVVADNVSYGNASDYVTLDEGDYTVEVRMEGDEEGSNVLDTFDVTVEGGTAYTVYAHGFDMPPESGDQPLSLTAAQDATTSVTLPAEGDDNETEDAVTEQTNETEDNETMAEEENETMGEENETMTEDENETVGDENETVGEDDNETVGEENDTAADEGNDTLGDDENDTVGEENDTAADEGNDTVGEENDTVGDEGNDTLGDDENESDNETALVAP